MNDKPKELEEHSAQIFELGCMERPVYLKEDVDAVIAELKRKLQDQCISCPVKMQEDDVVAELKQKLEDAKSTAYTESVDAGMDNRRLKRALWMTRAAMAKSEKDRWNAHIDCGNRRNRKDPAYVKTGKLLKVSEWRKLWADNERKCRAKAEEYK